MRCDTGPAAELDWIRPGKIRSLVHDPVAEVSRRAPSNEVVKTGSETVIEPDTDYNGPITEDPAAEAPWSEWASTQDLRVVERPVSPIPRREQLPPIQAGTTEDQGNVPEWNVLCTIAFATTVLGITSLFSALSPVLGWLVIAGILLGITGLVQASKRNQRGKGLAIAAIAVPVAMAAVLLLLLLTYGLGH